MENMFVMSDAQQSGDSRGSLPPALISRAQIELQKDCSAVTQRACVRCMLIPAVGGACVYLVLCGFVILNPALHLPMLLKLTWVTVFPVLLTLLFADSWKNGDMVFTAGLGGFCYPIRGNKSHLMCVPWSAIDRLKGSLGDDSRQLEVETKLAGKFSVLAPARGAALLAEGRWTLVFTFGIFARSGKVLVALNSLKQAAGAHRD